MNFDIPLVIFAGGESRRMGQNKALLSFGNSPTLTEFQLKRFKPYFKDIFVSCKDSSIFEFEANFIEDLDFGVRTPLVGLYSSLEKLNSTIAVLSVDTPFVKVEDFTTLYHDREENQAVIADYHPLCGIYCAEIKDIVKNTVDEGKYSFKALFEKIRVKYIKFDDESSFENLNYFDEYEKALERRFN